MAALVNILGMEQNGWHFADNIYKCIFFNENICIVIFDFTELYSQTSDW